MKIAVDTNIFFSAVLNSQSTFGDIIMNSEGIFEFVSAVYLKEEIENHKGRLSEYRDYPLIRSRIQLTKSLGA